MRPSWLCKWRSKVKSKLFVIIIVKMFDLIKLCFLHDIVQWFRKIWDVIQSKRIKTHYEMRRASHLNRNSSSECPLTPNFFIMVGKSMSWRYHFIPPWPLKSDIKSSYLHLNSTNFIFIDDVITSFVQLRLSRLPVIDFLPNFDML